MQPDASRIDLSVLIPTYNRPDALGDCLESLAAQEMPAGTTWEVIVLNDGGDPAAGAKAEQLREEKGLPVQFHTFDHMGPGAIRNKAFEMSRGRVLLMLNDDVTLRPGHLAHHLERHARRPGHAARGMTVWARECAGAGDFMSWVTRQSFFYYLVDDLESCGYEYWHTCDLSIDRKWVEGEKAILFSEEFPYAGFEDTEWGWRMELAGCQLAFLPWAVTDHHHVYTPEGLAERGRRNGLSGAILLDLVPELEGRAIRDFLEQRCDLPSGFLPKLKAMAKSFLGSAANKPTSKDADILKWRETFVEAYIDGFQREHARRHGRAYDPKKSSSEMIAPTA